MTDKLKTEIKNMYKYEILPFLYGVSLCAKDASGKDRMWDSPLKIEKTLCNKYHFITNILFEGHEMINECCKILKIKKLSRIFGFQKNFSYNEICLIIDTLPMLFTKYATDKHIYKFISFDKNEVIKECEKQRLPFLIEKTKKDIEFYESKYKQIDRLKSDLQYYENKLNSYNKK